MSLTSGEFIQAAEANINELAIGMGFTADHAIHPGSLSAFNGQWSQWTPIGVSNEEIDDQGTVNHIAVGWAKCPKNVRYNIIQWAVRANGYTVMPCLTDREMQPDIAMGFLRVNRKFSSKAVKYMYRNNVFMFDNIGSDLAKICQGFAQFGKPTHVFEHVVFMLGDEDSFDLGEFKIDMFANMLRNLPTTFVADHLTICLLRRSFSNNNQCCKFALSLSRLDVRKGLNIWCDTMHLALPLDTITQALDMGDRQVGAAGFLPLPGGEYIHNLVYSKEPRTIGRGVEDGNHAEL